MLLRKEVTDLARINQFHFWEIRSMNEDMVLNGANPEGPAQKDRPSCFHLFWVELEMRALKSNKRND
jgi:hypothetical protein